MTATASPDAKLSISILAKLPADVKLVQKALAHVYPGATIRAVANEDEMDESDASLAIVDADAAHEARIDHILDSQADTPIVLVVKDLTEVRRFSRHLTGRRAIITKADMEGIGLIQAIHHLMERQRLQEQLRKVSHRLKEQSIRDDLTKLFNHRHFNELLACEIKKANRYKRPLGLVIVSIKNFTALNEALGHHEGDRVLVRATEIIRGAVREVDIPARYGDNEFAVILPESDEAAAAIVAARIRDALSSIALPGEGALAHVAVSSGIGALSHTVLTKEDLLKTALGALIVAKRNGGGTICTSNDVESRRRELRENRQLIEQLSERIAALTSDAQLSYFRSLMKAIGDIPVVKKLLLPHSERVAFFAQRLAECVGFTGDSARSLYRAGLLHDAGKIAIDQGILTKPSRLSEPEEALVRQHPGFALQIFGRPPLLAAEIEAVLHHHERYDGGGYPDGIGGGEIPLAARIMAIAEAWDTMTTPQPYRQTPLTLDAALAELRSQAGRQFDPDLIDKFTGLIAG
ncbi:MAG: diguanylate cyclase [bacterium]